LTPHQLVVPEWTPPPVSSPEWPFPKCSSFLPQIYLLSPPSSSYIRLPTPYTLLLPSITYPNLLATPYHILLKPFYLPRSLSLGYSKNSISHPIYISPNYPQESIKPPSTTPSGFLKRALHLLDLTSTSGDPARGFCLLKVRRL
jgi:hypothetical protein